jgi:hypothetical protein
LGRRDPESRNCKDLDTGFRRYDTKNLTNNFKNSCGQDTSATQRAQKRNLDLGGIRWDLAMEHREDALPIARRRLFIVDVAVR